MGYRSEVAYLIGFEKAQDMSEFIAVVMAVGSEHQRDALKECCIDWPNRTINYSAEDVKWYDEFKDVIAHHELMEMAIERSDTNGYMFVRIGEDMTDIDERSEGRTDELHDFISIVRHLSIDMNTTPVGDDLSSDIPEDMND